MSDKAALSGDDSVVLNDRIFADFCDGDIFTVTFPNDVATLKTGKNGNTIYAFNASGKQADTSVRVQLGSDDDKFLNNLLNKQDEQNFAGTVLLAGQFTKNVGDGHGVITRVVYDLSGGIFLKRVEGKMNVENDTEQSVATYHMRFSKGTRSIS